MRVLLIIVNLKKRTLIVSSYRRYEYFEKTKNHFIVLLGQLGSFTLIDMYMGCNSAVRSSLSVSQSPG